MGKRIVTWLGFGMLSFVFSMSTSAIVWAQEEDMCILPTGTEQVTYAVSWGSGVLKVLTSDDTVARGQYVDVWVESDGLGCPPYHLQVTGTGFRFGSVSGPTIATVGGDGEEVQLWASSSACGSATIGVTDGCNQPSTAYVRCSSAGKWNWKGAICGGLTVPADTSWYSAPFLYFRKEQGNKRVTQEVAIELAGGCPSHSDSCCDQMWDSQHTNEQECGIRCNVWGFGGQGRCISGVPICDCYYEAYHDRWSCYVTRDLAYEEWECY